MRVFRRKQSTPDSAGATRTAARPGFWWYAAVVFLGFAVVALLLVLTLGDHGGNNGSEPAGQAPTRHAAGSGGDAGRPVGCRTDDANKQVPTSPPGRVRWELVSGVATPVSAAGPRLRDGAARYCYAHTPTGALLAAVNISRGMGAKYSSFLQVARHSLVQNQYEQQMAQQLKDPSSVGQQSGASAGQLAGFKVISYTPQQATIAIVAQFAQHQGAYQAETVVMQWDQGDWRTELQPGPRAAATISYPQDVSDFVPWSGVS